MNHTAKPQRPLSLTILAALIMVASLVVLLVVIPPLMEPTTSTAGGQMPRMMLLQAMTGLAAAYGLWNLQEWGRLLTIARSVLGILQALSANAFQTVGSGLVQIFIHVAIIIFLVQPRISSLFAAARQNDSK